MPPVVRVQHTKASIYTALCSAHMGLGNGQRPSPSRQAHRPKRISEGKGSGGAGKARAWKMHLPERCKWVGTEVGIRTSVASHLVVVLEISKIQVWKLASRFGDLRQGQAVSRGLQRE